jgi:hypothetical protein
LESLMTIQQWLNVKALLSLAAFKCSNALITYTSTMAYCISKTRRQER